MAKAFASAIGLLLFLAAAIGAAYLTGRLHGEPRADDCAAPDVDWIKSIRL